MRTTITIAVISLCVLIFSYSPDTNNKALIENYYTINLDSLRYTINYLEKTIIRNNNQKEDKTNSILIDMSIMKFRL